MSSQPSGIGGRIGSGVRRVREIAGYLLAGGARDIELFGMYGAQNIGDEAMMVVGLETLPAGRTIAVVRPTGLPLIGAALARKTRPQLVFGGGTLIHGGAENDDRGGSNPWLDVAERYVRAGSRVAFMGTGISFREDQLAQPSPGARRWQAVLAHAGYVGVRGPLSQRAAARLRIEADVFGDAAFGLHRPGRADAPRDPARIGFNFGECLGDQDHYEAVSAQLLRTLAPRFTCTIYVVRPSDRAATRRIIAASSIAPDRYQVTEIFEDVHAYMADVARCHALVALKLHAAGLALVAGVPSLLFGYLGKCRDFMLPIGLERCLVDMAADADTVERQVEALLTSPEEYRNDAGIAAMAAHQRQAIARYFG